MATTIPQISEQEYTKILFIILRERSRIDTSISIQTIPYFGLLRMLDGQDKSILHELGPTTGISIANFTFKENLLNQNLHPKLKSLNLKNFKFINQVVRTIDPNFLRMEFKLLRKP